MQINVGKTDKIIRIVAGLTMLVLGYLYSSWLGLVGIVPIATALMGNCPAYSILGINTCKRS